MTVALATSVGPVLFEGSVLVLGDQVDDQVLAAGPHRRRVTHAVLCSDVRVQRRGR